ncbi:indole-3-glycerol phosphate synthase TrpC [Aquibacillus sediminis]|uniref:indole-3-glycerol phosphate synthase TrpC n=1 Tax=Aquibacillus sediminis TaxID=2574734 RepID=UPI001107F57E|nr:indole-3-glycerol phosphate synthase TrpC [Aquibacillus sediminis]
MTILDKILQEKQKEVAVLKSTYQSSSVATRLEKRSLYQAFMESDYMNIIAEIKRASPSKGVINKGVDPATQAKGYQNYGAGAISVLTDQPFFKGTMEDLQNVRANVEIPILNKDFIVDEIQIDRAYDYGASVILLIAAALPPARLADLYSYATTKGLEVLFEVHNEQEMQIANDIGAKIVGINNRDLKTFHVDLAVTEKLVPMVETPDALIISESGFKTTEDVNRIMQAGVKGILVGETMMRSDDLQQTFNQLRIPF